MKKYLLLIVLLLFPAFIFADMAAPNPRLDVVVANRDGITAESDKEKMNFSYGTVLKNAWISEYDDGTFYVSFELDGKQYVFNCQPGDFIPKVDEVNSSNIEEVLGESQDEIAAYTEGAYFKYEEEHSVYVFYDIDNARKGPGEFFDKSDVIIPKGTTLKFQYLNTSWLLTKYNGKEVWVRAESVTSSVLDHSECYIVNFSEDELFITKDYELELKPYDDDNTKIGVIIPRGTFLKAKYSHKYKGESNYYVEYNGQGGWVKKADYSSVYSTKNPVGMYVIKDITATDIYTNKKITINKNTIIDDVYLDYGFYGDVENDTIYIKYDNSIYNVSSDINVDYNDRDIISFGKARNYIFENGEYDLFDNPVDLNKIGTFKSDGKNVIHTFYDSYASGYYLYGDFNGVKGWINTKDVDYSSADDEENIEEKNQKEDKDQKEKTKTDRKITSVKEYVLYCMVGALIVAIVAFVTIKVVNKKKKGNALVEDNTLPEQPVDEEKKED